MEGLGTSKRVDEDHEVLVMPCSWVGVQNWLSDAGDEQGPCGKEQAFCFFIKKASLNIMWKFTKKIRLSIKLS